MYIAIAGNIGAGKTTLTKMLAKYYGWEPRFESVSFNPYLEDYYTNIERWSFAVETYFLKERFKDMLRIGEVEHTVVQDRSIFEGVYVFVPGEGEAPKVEVGTGNTQTEPVDTTAAPTVTLEQLAAVSYSSQTVTCALMSPVPVRRKLSVIPVIFSSYLLYSRKKQAVRLVSVPFA